MFGHDDDDQNQPNLPVTLPDNAAVPAPLTSDPFNNNVGANNDNGFLATPVPGAETPVINGTITPAINTDTPAAPEEAQAATPPAPAISADELMSLKQQALQQLSPLMDQLDQTPEERFRTTMMMIQASDNDSLIKNAYEAALAIPDEKVRAQALLDVINEINYFTQKDGSTPAAA